MSQRVYLVSRRLDPVLGIASGLWAYYLYETRLQRPVGHTLPELLRWKWDKRKQLQVQSLSTDPAADLEGWAELNAELAKQSRGAKV